MSYLENRGKIESGWDKTFGDRKTEIVIIGQEMDERLIRIQLDACLATDKEIENLDWENGASDEWPVPRAFPLD